MLTALGQVQGRAAALEEGVAVGIVYDTSGSMNDPVRDSKGSKTPKYVIASRALEAIVQRIQTYATNASGGAPRKVMAGVFVFQGNGAREAVKFGPFNAAAIQNWTKKFNSPNGATPLGNALDSASKVVLNSSMSRKHVVVLTDGINTAGPEPGAVLTRLKADMAKSGNPLSVHFVAFDVDAKRFEPLRKLGATVVGAADEKQLNTQLEFIFEQKILLEEEEKPISKPK